MPIDRTPQPIPTDRDLWERWPGETIKAYDAWLHYFNQPKATRSLRTAITTFYPEGENAVTKKLTQWGLWSARWRWQERLKAWADYEGKLAAQAKAQDIEDMNRRHTNLAIMMQGLAAEQVQLLQKLVAENPDLQRLTADNIARWLDLATRLERTARGEPADIKRLDLTSLTDDELKAIIDS